MHHPPSLAAWPPTRHPPAGPNRAATLSEVAGIITTLTRDHLGSLLVHPGHATIGVYYLARRHEVRQQVYTGIAE
jgi:hypothetical protein